MCHILQSHVSHIFMLTVATLLYVLNAYAQLGQRKNYLKMIPKIGLTWNNLSDLPQNGHSPPALLRAKKADPLPRCVTLPGKYNVRVKDGRKSSGLFSAQSGPPSILDIGLSNCTSVPVGSYRCPSDQQAPRTH